MRTTIQNALLVFAKKPEPGKVKTRLTPPLSPQDASELYSCFLKDSFSQYAHLAQKNDWQIFICYTPSNAGPFFEQLWSELDLSHTAKFIPQEEGDLGQRMEKAMRRLTDDKYRTVIIGTDHPTLPDRYIENAFAELSHVDAVVGPSEDGGYYALGLDSVHPAIFENIAWSTDTVYQRTIANLESAHYSWHGLPVWYDVDDVSSFLRLSSEIGYSGSLYTKKFLNEMSKS